MYALGPAGFFFILLQIKRTWQLGGKRRFILLVPAAVACLVVIVILNSRIPVDSAFTDSYHRYGERLGKPVAKSLRFSTEPVHQALFQHGVKVFHVGKQYKFHFQLFPNLTWRKAYDAHYGTQDPRFGIESLRKEGPFRNCTAPLVPPWGGMAASVIEDSEGPNNWNFGCIQSQCLIDQSKVRFQEFEHGFLVGGLAIDKTDTDATGFAYGKIIKPGKILTSQ